MGCNGVYANTTSDNKEITKEDKVELNSRIYQKRNWAESGIKVAVNGNQITFPDQEPLLDADIDRTYVPVRFLAEALGAEVDWDDTHKVVIIKNYGIDGKDTKTIHYLRLGESKMVIARYRNGMNDGANSIVSYYFPNDIYPLIVNDRTMLPFRYVAELLGAQVYYDPTNGIAHCVKRDLSNKEYRGGDEGVHSFPILSTVIGDYFADELNKWYTDYFNSSANVLDDYNNPTYWDGTLADTTVWAGMDHLTHPEWHERDGQGAGYGHKFTGNLENENGCYEPFYRTYLPNELIYYHDTVSDHKRTFYPAVNNWKPNWDGDMLYTIRGLYAENFAQIDNLGTFGGKNYTKSYNEYLDLTKNWGLNINADKTGLNNLKLGGIFGRCSVRVIDEEMYREISRYVIGLWAGSPGHLANLRFACNGYKVRSIGFSIVGDNAYYNVFR